MADGSDLADRVRVLEGKVGKLEELPGRMDALESQFVQFRQEMHGEFSAFKKEIRDEIRNEFREFGELMDKRFALTNKAIRDTRRHMLVLHEKVIESIKTLGEGLR